MIFAFRLVFFSSIITGVVAVIGFRARVSARDVARGGRDGAPDLGIVSDAGKHQRRGKNYGCEQRSDDFEHLGVFYMKLSKTQRLAVGLRRSV